MKRKQAYCGTDGSLTIEALLILPVILLTLGVFLRWGLILRDELNDSLSYGDRAEAEGQTTTWEEAGGGGFLWGGPPARRIRDADLLIDLGHSIREMLPTWF